MEAAGPSAKLTRFANPSENLSGLDPETAADLLAAASDLSLVIDARGIVRDVAFSSADLAREVYRSWIGAKWVDTVTVESRIKVEELLKEATENVPTRWRQVNFTAESGPDVPVRLSAIRYGKAGRVVVVGRELRAMALLQQRLAEAQQAMEREYARIRNAEKRYRLLFQLASEPVLIVDAANQRVVEVNPAAAALIGKDARKLTGAAFAELFGPESRQAEQSFVAALRVAPRVDNVHVQLAGSGEAVLLSGSLFRQDSNTFLLVLLARLSGKSAQVSPEDARLLQAVEKSPDAFVVADYEGKILTANPAFVDLVQAATIEQVRGESIERWIGRGDVDLDVLMENVRTHGSVRNFSTIMRIDFGAAEDIEVSAVDLSGSAPPSLGFTLRAAGPRTIASRERLGGRELPRTAEQFADLVGRVPLKSLVRETTDLIERLCIEAALELTNDNRASAAEMLGLSRQGFYSKLRRYGLGDLDGEDGEAAD